MHPSIENTLKPKIENSLYYFLDTLLMYVYTLLPYILDAFSSRTLTSKPPKM